MKIQIEMTREIEIPDSLNITDLADFEIKIREKHKMFTDELVKYAEDLIATEHPEGDYERAMGVI